MSDNHEAIHKELTELQINYAELRTKQEEMKSDLADIKLQVTNHLPHQIDEVKVIAEDLRDKYSQVDTIARFLSSVCKIVFAIAGAVWSVVQIINAFHKK